MRFRFFLFGLSRKFGPGQCHLGGNRRPIRCRTKKQISNVPKNNQLIIKIDDTFEKFDTCSPMKFVGRKTKGAKATLRRFPMFRPKPKVGERFVRAWGGSFQVFYMIFIGYIWLVLYLVCYDLYILYLCCSGPKDNHLVMDNGIKIWCAKYVRQNILFLFTNDWEA